MLYILHLDKEIENPTQLPTIGPNAKTAHFTTSWCRELSAVTAAEMYYRLQARGICVESVDIYGIRHRTGATCAKARPGTIEVKEGGIEKHLEALLYTLVRVSDLALCGDTMSSGEAGSWNRYWKEKGKEQRTGYEIVEKIPARMFLNGEGEELVSKVLHRDYHINSLGALINIPGHFMAARAIMSLLLLLPRAWGMLECNEYSRSGGFTMRAVDDGIIGTIWGTMARRLMAPMWMIPNCQEYLWTLIYLLLYCTRPNSKQFMCGGLVDRDKYTNGFVRHIMQLRSQLKNYGRAHKIYNNLKSMGTGAYVTPKLLSWEANDW